VGEQQSNQSPVALLGAILLYLIAVTLSGCNSNAGPTRYEVEGGVTLNGKPAPNGEIAFQPDTAQQNTGPGAVTTIKNGRFKTLEGKGVSVGPHKVRIIAYDGIANSESANGNVLTAKPYETTVNIPADNSVHNFDVPASHLVK